MILFSQIEDENQQFQDERAERIRLLHDRQSREIHAFDDESTRLGFNALSICEASNEPNFDDDTSLTGSMLSLAHSNSSSSFSHQ